MPATQLDPSFRTARARLGGLTRAKKWPRRKQRQLMLFCQERRLGQTRCRTFEGWLKARGSSNGR